MMYLQLGCDLYNKYAIYAQYLSMATLVFLGNPNNQEITAISSGIVVSMPESEILGA
jgi:hypothetical protein